MGFSLRLSKAFRRPRRFAKSRYGGAAIEFAIIGPVLLLMMSGMFTYGGYFLTAHTVQQLANDAARAAIAGLDDDERTALARQSVESSMEAQPHMRGRLTALDVARAGTTITVSMVYDASEDLYWAFHSVLPTPAPEIAKRATIRMGGY